jgi:hypothetical protein
MTDVSIIPRIPTRCSQTPWTCRFFPLAHLFCIPSLRRHVAATRKLSLKTGLKGRKCAIIMFMLLSLERGAA